MPLATNVQLRPKGAELFELAKVTPASTRTWLFIYGPKKVGKTTTAFTASKVFGGLGCPIEDRIKAVASGDFEPIHIDDMAFLQTDMGGSTSAIDLGVTLEHVYSLEVITENGYDACDGMVALINAVKNELAGRVRWLVIDTVSILDQMMFPRAIELGGADRFAKFDIQLQQHRQVIAALRSWPGDVIICSHARGLPEIVPGNTATALASAMSQERQRKAIYQTIPDVVPEITGKGAQSWLANCSLIGAMLQRPHPQRKGQFQRRLFSSNSMGYEGGSRFESLLSAMANGKLESGIEPNLWPLMTEFRQRLAR